MLRAPKLLTTLLCVALLTAAGEARAQPQARAEAKQRFARGEAQYQRGSYRRALTEYEAAYRLYPHPAFLFNIAQCHRLVGDAASALAAYQRYLQEWQRLQPGSPVPFRGEVEEHIATLSAPPRETPRELPRPLPTSEEATLTPPAPTGSLRLEGLPPGARVACAGEVHQAEGSSMTLSLPPGPHRIRVSADGLIGWEHEVDIRRGTIQLQRLSTDHQRSRLWLGVGVAATSLTVGMLALAATYNVKTNNDWKGSPEWESNRRTSITGYALTGVFAAGAVVSWILYARSGAPRLASASLAALSLSPAPGRLLLSGAFTF